MDSYDLQRVREIAYLFTISTYEIKIKNNTRKCDHTNTNFIFTASLFYKYTYNI